MLHRYETLSNNSTTNIIENIKNKFGINRVPSSSNSIIIRNKNTHSDSWAGFLFSFHVCVVLKNM